MRFSISLWTINRWLRYTGFRLHVDYDNDVALEDRKHSIGVAWWGKSSKGMRS